MIRSLADLQARAGSGYPARRILSELTYLTEVFDAQGQDVPTDVLAAIAELQARLDTDGAITNAAVRSCEAELANYHRLPKAIHFFAQRMRTST